MVTHMDYDRARWLRDQTLAAADDMSTQSQDADLPGVDRRPPVSGLLDAAYVPRSAFGNAVGGAECADAWRDVVDQATLANANLRGVLMSDATRLDEVIACFQSTDHESADDICTRPRSATVMSAHLHSHDDPLIGDGPSPAWDDYLRATQHDRMVDYATDRPGAVIVGTDSNVSIDTDADGNLTEYDAGPLAPAAVARFEDEGFENVGDFSQGEPGVGTSSSGRSIDYVWSSGLNANPAQRVDGGPSDHDGQRVDFTLPHW